MEREKGTSIIQRKRPASTTLLSPHTPTMHPVLAPKPPNEKLM